MRDDGHKVGGEVVAGHVSYGEGAVGAALGAEPVAQGQGTDGSGELRQTDVLGVAVGGSTTAGEGESVAADGVGIGAAVGDMRHIGCRGAVGIADPAGRQNAFRIVGCAGDGIEILDVGRYDKVAGGIGIDGLAPVAGVGGTADGTHTHLIGCGGGETDDGGRM